MSIILNEKQSFAVKDSNRWFNSPSDKSIYVIAGLAGTGKTTVVNYIINEFGLDVEEIAYCAFSGMAANCLTRKGNTATTIHRLIYTVKKFYSERDKKYKLKFELKESLPDKIKLIIIDELSMVPSRMIEELYSFGIKMIGLGDPCQTKPVAGSSNNLLDKPNVFLNEIHRQALENPITYLSMLARENKIIKPGNYGNKVFVIRESDVDEDLYARFMSSLSNEDQMICGKNKTCKQFNDFYRYVVKGYEDNLPVDGDKVVCLKNNWELFVEENGIETFLVNGLIGNLISGTEIKSKIKTINFDFLPTYNTKESFDDVACDMIPFIDDRVDKKGTNVYEYYEDLKLFRRVKSENTINYFDFAYAITVHKSQGSEYNKVLYYEEILDYKEHYRELYTAITRAKEKLMIIQRGV